MNTREKCERLARAYYGARDVPSTVAMVKTRKYPDTADYAWGAFVDGVGLPVGGATEGEALDLLAGRLRSSLRRHHAWLAEAVSADERALAERRAVLADATLVLDATEE